MTTQAGSDKPEESGGVFTWLFIAGIVIGLGILIYIGSCGGPPGAPIAQTRVLLDNLRTALEAYHDDFKFYPAGDVENDKGNINMVLALSDSSPCMSGGDGSPWLYYEFR